jgi:hypothetical protein
MTNDFICFSDLKIPNAISYNLFDDIKLSTVNYLFKLQYLSKIKSLDYDYFIFLDADSFFVRKPEIAHEELITESTPWISFLEGPINSLKTKRTEWWGVPNLIIESNYRSLGVISKEIRNINAGYWVCKKEFVSTANHLMVECFKKFHEQGFRITEEIPMAYLTSLLYPDNDRFYLENYKNYWSSDWTGVFENQIPYNKTWRMTEYMTGNQYEINPAIVHAMRSDTALGN